MKSPKTKPNGESAGREAGGAAWPRKSISDIAKHSLGKMLDKAKNLGTPRPYLRNLNVRWFEFDLSNLIEMKFQDSEEQKFTAVRGDVLICEGGYPGRAAIWDADEPIHFQKAIHRVRFHEPDRNKWFVYYLYYLDATGELRQHFSGTGIQHFTGETLARLQIPVPPLPEQRRIVGILDEAFAGIATAKANAEKNLRNAREVFESHLDHVYSRRGVEWKVKRVGEIAQYSFGKMLDKAKNKGIPQRYLRNINVRWFAVDLEDMLEMPFLPEETDKYTVTKGDVLICEGGYPGRCAIWEEDYPVHFQKALHRVRFDEPKYNKWLVYYLYLLDSSGRLRQHFTGSGIQHFTGESLGKLSMPIPPVSEASKIVLQVEELHSQVRRLESLYQQKLTALEALKKSLLHQAFSGRL
jgi:type I restriction enzyme S subunit